MADYVTEFIPEIWSAKILMDKLKAQVFVNLANRDYEGDLIYGNKVRIPQIGGISVSDYTRNNFATGLTRQYPEVSDLFLNIEKQKYFYVNMDKMDIVQSKVPFVDTIATKAAYKLADTQDEFIADLVTQAGLATTTNNSSTRVTLGSSNCKKEFLLMGKEFSKKNIPMINRWCVAPPSLIYELIDSGILEQSNNDTLWKEAKMFNAYGWNIYESNNVSSTSDTTFELMFGYSNESITMAEQIQDTEMGKLQSAEGFGIYMKGLHVYGARIIPDRTGVIYATITND